MGEIRFYEGNELKRVLKVVNGKLKVLDPFGNEVKDLEEEVQAGTQVDTYLVVLRDRVIDETTNEVYVGDLVNLNTGEVTPMKGGEDKFLQTETMILYKINVELNKLSKYIVVADPNATNLSVGTSYFFGVAFIVNNPSTRGHLEIHSMPVNENTSGAVAIYDSDLNLLKASHSVEIIHVVYDGTSIIVASVQGQGGGSSPPSA